MAKTWKSSGSKVRDMEDKHPRAEDTAGAKVWDRTGSAVLEEQVEARSLQSERGERGKREGRTCMALGRTWALVSGT